MPEVLGTVFFFNTDRHRLVNNIFFFGKNARPGILQQITHQIRSGSYGAHDRTNLPVAGLLNLHNSTRSPTEKKSSSLRNLLDAG